MILFRMQGGCLSAGKIKMARNDLIRIKLNGQETEQLARLIYTGLQYTHL